VPITGTGRAPFIDGEPIERDRVPTPEKNFQLILDNKAAAG
jgi:hypothetical protein